MYCIAASLVGGGYSMTTNGRSENRHPGWHGVQTGQERSRIDPVTGGARCDIRNVGRPDREHNGALSIPVERVVTRTRSRPASYAGRTGAGARGRSPGSDESVSRESLACHVTVTPQDRRPEETRLDSDRIERGVNGCRYERSSPG